MANRIREKEKLNESDQIALYWAEHNHALAWIRIGKYEWAKDEFRKVICRAPIDRRSYARLAEVYARRKDYKQAINYLIKAFKLSEPDLTNEGDLIAWCEVAYDLAELLATCPDASVRDGKRVQKIAAEVLAMTDNASVANFVLAAAYAELGDFEKAVELQTYMMAQPLLHANSPHQQARLEAYKRKQPFRLTRYEEP